MKGARVGILPSRDNDNACIAVQWGAADERGSPNDACMHCGVTSEDVAGYAVVACMVECVSRKCDD